MQITWHMLLRMACNLHLVVFEQVYDADEFKKLKAEGMTVSAIARLFNCKRDTVYRLIR